MKQPADVCLVLEGTYPYVSGGVSGWVHRLISAQSDLTFSLVCILPRREKLKYKYQLPPNVIEVRNVFLQNLRGGAASLPARESKELFVTLESGFLHLLHQPSLKTLEMIIDALNKPEQPLGEEVLLDSMNAWQMLTRMYRGTMRGGSFLDYFWSWRGILEGFYSIVLADIPEAAIYHALCTGYAGLYLASASLKTGKPCLVTEHGIYTNERRIEIIAASWIHDQQSMDLNIGKRKYERDLKDYWIDTFYSYSRLCYEACAIIATLYEGNQRLQIEDGADRSKSVIIPNGVDVQRYASLERKNHSDPTIALIGRVVPIKDVKTYIHAVSLVKQIVPNLKAYVIGPVEEDEEYYTECVQMVEREGLKETVFFTGKVNIEDYLPEIDLIVLTSISEAQPLAVLEAGAAGIPAVVTDVGSCREMIEGKKDESPNLGLGGRVCPLSNPKAVGDAIITLLIEKETYRACSKAIAARVEKYYDLADQNARYRQIYEILKEPVGAG